MWGWIGYRPWGTLRRGLWLRPPMVSFKSVRGHDLGGDVRVRHPLSISNHPSAPSQPGHYPREKEVMKVPS